MDEAERLRSDDGGLSRSSLNHVRIALVLGNQRGHALADGLLPGDCSLKQRE
jgi:hypothetical protein